MMDRQNLVNCECVPPMERKNKKEKDQYPKGHWSNPVLHKCAVCGRIEEFPSTEDCIKIRTMISKGRLFQAVRYFESLQCEITTRCIFCGKVLCKDHTYEKTHNCTGLNKYPVRKERIFKSKTIFGITRKELENLIEKQIKKEEEHIVDEMFKAYYGI